MTLKEILDLKEQGYSLDEIEKINNILESTGKEDEPKSEDDPKPEDDKDYKKMYEDLKAETEKKAARKDRGDENSAQDDLQEAVAAYFKNIFT